MITIKSTSKCPESVTVMDENGNDLLGCGAISVQIDMRPNELNTATITYLVEALDVKAQKEFRHEHLDYSYTESDKMYMKVLVAVAIISGIIFMFKVGV